MIDCTIIFSIFHFFTPSLQTLLSDSHTLQSFYKCRPKEWGVIAMTENLCEEVSFLKWLEGVWVYSQISNKFLWALKDPSDPEYLFQSCQHFNWFNITICQLQFKTLWNSFISPSLEIYYIENTARKKNQLSFIHPLIHLKQLPISLRWH